ncbi:MAG: cupin domain-containing protein [Hyphomicrobiales bacterium]|nr:cupin domain-containing protein [Hyphomicrobiales bacterium]
MAVAKTKTRADRHSGQSNASGQSGVGSRIGYQLKRARLLKGLRLLDVAEAIGLSSSLISKIENNKINPSLSTLHRLAQVLETSVSALFAMDEKLDKVVLKQEERPIAGKVQGIVQWEGIEAEIMIPYEEGRLLEGFVFVMEPGGHSGGVLQHDGEECGYVLEGELEIVVGGKTHHLKTGSSFFFYSNVPHSYRNPGKTVARVIWINTPPTF